MKALQEVHPIEIVPTFLGAHTIPREFRDARTRYIDLLTKEMIPRVAQ
jgi:imidazolonepropionase